MTKFAGIEGKVAFISGSSKGIGLSIAEAFAAQGAKVVLNSRSLSTDHECVGKVKEAAEKSGYQMNPLVIAGDVSSAEDTKRMFEEIKNAEGFGSVDFGINNAGISKDGLFLRQKEDDWSATLGINLTGVRNCCLEEIKMMRKTGGCIVNMSSVIGQHGNTGQSAYAASKAGIIGLTLSLAEEYARLNIRVNAVAPGYVKTEMTENVNAEAKSQWEDLIPMKRIGESSEIADAVLFLCSSSSTYITGQTLGVDGGWFRR